MQETIPQGKGRPRVAVKDADDLLLTQFLAWFDGAGGQPAKSKAAADAARAELEARRKPKPPPAQAAPSAQRQAARPAAATTAMTRAAQPAALAMAHDANAINERFAELRKTYHLVTPATHVDMLPEGFGVSVAFVVVSPNAEKGGPGDVYSVGGGKVGLSAHVIQQVGVAAGVDWDSRLSGRLDNGSDPHYCHYRAVGWAKNYDGTPRQIMGEVEIDARDGSPLIDEIEEKAERRKQQYPNDKNHDGGASQTLELRKFLLRHAETKAQNRAIARGLGIKRSYQPKELEKPFAVARLSFTGYSEDPELRREFAKMGAAAALSGTRALYGGAPPAALPAAPVGHAPPELEHEATKLTNEDLQDLVSEGEFDDGPPDPDPGNEQAQADEKMRQPGED